MNIAKQWLLRALKRLEGLLETQAEQAVERLHDGQTVISLEQVRLAHDLVAIRGKLLSDDDRRTFDRGLAQLAEVMPGLRKALERKGFRFEEGRVRYLPRERA